jgi:hypothetical protein
MGVPATALTRLMQLHRAGFLPKRAAMLELGEQNLNCTGQAEFARAFVKLMAGSDLAADERLVRLCDGGLAGDLFELAGFSVTCLDVFAGKRTVEMDLNYASPPDRFRAAFDIVTNFGTTEHILNQYNTFKFIHDCVRPGGLMVHQLPMEGWSDHCLVKYTPKFFFLLAMANEYMVVDFRINSGAICTNDVSYWTSLQGDVLGAKSSTGNPVQNTGCFFALRKDRDRPFAPPVDSTSGPLSPAEIAKLRLFRATERSVGSVA